VQKDIDLVPYQIVKADNGDAWVEVRGKKLAPPQVCADGAAQDEEDRRGLPRRGSHRGGDHRAGLLQRRQRQATKDAGRIAGLEVKRIINEPTAAALAYGLDKQARRAARSRSTTSAAAPSTSRSSRSRVDGERQFEVLSTNGDTFLGGEDFDQRIIDYLVDRVQEGTGHRPAQGRAGPAAPEGGRREGQDRAVVAAMQTDINLPYITADAIGPKHLNVKLTRAKLEALVEDLHRAHHRALPARPSRTPAEGRRHRRRRSWWAA
jgi:molecular chaperone DnaK